MKDVPWKKMGCDCFAFNLSFSALWVWVGFFCVN